MTKKTTKKQYAHSMFSISLDNFEIIKWLTLFINNVEIILS